MSISIWQSETRRCPLCLVISGLLCETSNRQLLLEWMIRTRDHALEAFRNINDKDAIETYWLSQEAAPPFIPVLEKMERMIHDLNINYDFQGSVFDLTIDPG